MEKKYKIIDLYVKIFLYLIAVFVPFVFYTPVFAATLHVSPLSESCSVEETCSVDILISSTDEAMNAVSGVLTFPQNMLHVESLSKEDSIISFWIQEPSFSTNSVTFEGIITNPGFTGSSGNIIKIIFNAVSAGTAELSFSSGSVLANDGKGTSILENLQGGSLNIEMSSDEDDDDDDEDDEEEGDGDEDDGDDEEGDGDIPSSDPGDSDTETGGSTNRPPSSPEISSPTHPDPDAWYSNSTAVFTWTTSSDIQDVRLSVSPEPQEMPTVAYPTIDSKEITGIADGSWYLHAQLKNINGWGEASHFRFQIDTQKPSYFNMERIIPEDGIMSPYSEFLFDAGDDMSGIDHYVVTVDKQESIVWHDDGTHIFRVSKLVPGEHIITVNVVDKANNFIVHSERIYIDPLDTSDIAQYLEPKDEGEIGIWEIGGPITTRITPVISYTGIGIGVGQALIFVGNARSLVDIWLIILRLLSFLSSFFRRKKSEPWGVVYDSVTKQPLDPAYVSISTADKKEESAAITDLDGRYGFLVPHGNYLIKANKTHYVFPSEKLRGRTKDELYNNLYFGEPIGIDEKNEDLIRYNIPLDPIGFDWNEYAKRERGLFQIHSKRKRVIMFVSNLIFFSGFTLSAYLLWVQPVMINFGLFALYAAILVFQEFWKTSHPITKLLDANSNDPISFAIIKAYISGNDILLKTVVTDERGRFYMLTPPGKYYLTVEVKQDDGSYTQPYRTMPVSLKEGVVLKNLYIKKSKKE